MKKMLSGAVLAAALIVGTPVAVHAATANNYDPAGDTTTLKGSPTWAHKAETDITKFVIWNDTTYDYFQWTMRDLNSTYRLPRFEWQAGAVHNSYGSANFSLMGVAGPNPCTRTASLNYTANTVTVKFPRSCFTKATWATTSRATYYSSSGYTKVQDKNEDYVSWVHLG
ncbi:MAG TPA: hypothetical protein VJ872_15275 [Nocardioides sp.]|nr:hypothetical protein [Nocardioides sp.]